MKKDRKNQAPSLRSPGTRNAEYTVLLNQIKKVLVEGRRRIEEERVATRWEAGRLIHVYILKHAGRGDYGKEVLQSLAHDLGVDLSELQRCVQFARIYSRPPKVGGRRLFTWTHYRKLITVADHRKRLLLEKNAAEKGWTADEFALRIREDGPGAAPERDNPRQLTVPSSENNKEADRRPLTPLRGLPYTYQIVERRNAQTGLSAGLRVDLGFGVFYKGSRKAVSAFNKGDIIEPILREDVYKFSKSERGVKDLYTYRAEIERIIDGDTLKVRFDLGFDMEARDTLRLRGIDCPEMDTKEGQAAKAFAAAHLKDAEYVIVRSSRADKYARYLADVFIPRGKEPDPATDIYLNNLLLETGHAVRME